MLELDRESWAREALEAVKGRLSEIKRKVRVHGNPKACINILRPNENSLHRDMPESFDISS